MSTKNYDSSQLTRKVAARVLGGYANAISAANNASNGPTTVRTTQPTYQSAVTVPAALGQLAETQSGYDTLKSLSPPTVEQASEWQAIADQFNIGITF